MRQTIYHLEMLKGPDPPDQPMFSTQDINWMVNATHVRDPTAPVPHIIIGVCPAFGHTGYPWGFVSLAFTPTNAKHCVIVGSEIDAEDVSISERIVTHIHQLRTVPEFEECSVTLCLEQVVPAVASVVWDRVQASGIKLVFECIYKQFSHSLVTMSELLVDALKHHRIMMHHKRIEPQYQGAVSTDIMIRQFYHATTSYTTMGDFVAAIVLAYYNYSLMVDQPDIYPHLARQNITK